MTTGTYGRGQTRALMLGLMLAWILTGLPVHAGQTAPHSLVLMIGDGYGPAAVTLARAARGAPLALDSLLLGSLSTAPAAGLVTDSAAAATALASGQLTRNGMVGMDPDGRLLATLLETAEARGMATGLVTTTSITNATPACFAAHVISRTMTARIAEQLLDQGIEVLLGGGRDDFLPLGAGGTRSDGLSLLARARERGMRVISRATELVDVPGPPLLGLFAPAHLDYELDRDAQTQPSLARMTASALRLLASDPDGFLLMVEGGRIDHAGHGNDPAGLVAEALAFDRAVEQVLGFLPEHPATLLVVTADHETGGLSLGRDVDGMPNYAYRPEVLARAHVSAEALSGKLLAGADPADSLARDWGLTGVDADRLARLRQLARQGPMAGPALTVTLGRLLSERAGLAWSTSGHTGVDVPLGARGPGATRFIGHHANTEVARLVAELMHFDLPGLTEQLRASAEGR